VIVQYILQSSINFVELFGSTPNARMETTKKENIQTEITLNMTNPDIHRSISEILGENRRADSTLKPKSTLTYYSTVTDFAKLRGLSTSQPRKTAM
jgi:hypothetical protein